MGKRQANGGGWPWPPDASRFWLAERAMDAELSLALSVGLDVLWLLVINVRQLSVRFIIRPEQFIQLRMDGLGVPMLGSLDDQCHYPRRQRCEAMPVDMAKGRPRHPVEEHDYERRRAGSQHAERCQPFPDDCLHRRSTPQLTERSSQAAWGGNRGLS